MDLVDYSQDVWTCITKTQSRYFWKFFKIYTRTSSGIYTISPINWGFKDQSLFPSSFSLCFVNKCILYAGQVARISGRTLLLTRRHRLSDCTWSHKDRLENEAYMIHTDRQRNTCTTRKELRPRWWWMRRGMYQAVNIDLQWKDAAPWQVILRARGMPFPTRRSSSGQSFAAMQDVKKRMI